MRKLCLILLAVLLPTCCFALVSTPENLQSQILSVQNIATTNEQNGNFSKAIELYQKVLYMYLEHNGETDATAVPAVISSLHYLMYDLNRIEDFNQFKYTYMEKCKEKRKDLYLPVFLTFLSSYKGNPSDLAYYNNRSEFALHGDCSEALSFYDAFCPFANDDFTQAWLYLSKADILMFGKRYKESQEILDKAKKLTSEKFGDSSKQHLETLLFQEILYATEGDFEMAIAQATLNLKSIDEKYAENTFIKARLQRYYNKTGDHKKSIEYGERTSPAAFYAERFLTHQFYTTNYNGPASNYSISYNPQDTQILLADSYLKLHDNAKAVDNIKQVLDFALTSIKAQYSNFAFIKIKNLERWVNHLTTYSPLYAAKTHNQGLATTAYNAALIYKQLSLNAEKLLQNMIYETRDTELIAKQKELVAAKQQMNNTDNESVINSLSAQIMALNTQLIKDIRKYGDYADGLDVSWKQVKSKLSPGDIAIEFLSYTDTNGETVYLANCIKANSESPQLYTLCKLSQLNDFSNLYESSALYSHIWEPITAELADIKRIYFSATGAINQIGIEYLKDTHGNYMSEKYEMYRLSSTRELLVLNNRQEKLTNAVLYGGITYDLSDEELRNLKHRGAPASSDETIQGMDESINRAGLQFLPGTIEEIDNINETLMSNDVEADIYTGSDATEESFKALSEKNIHMLHIATHGFYIPRNTKSKMEKMYEYLTSKLGLEERSLSRSGLMMAGAANTLSSKSTVNDREDGILTSKEISQLNLGNVELVVLSACETALGDINSEGVYGLQRGLKKAGVKTMLLSLWKVSDEATKILMTAFYKNLMESGNIRSSFVNAQRSLREYDNHKFDNYKYWAAFVLIDAI